MSAQNNTQRGPCHCDFGIAGIVMRRNVLFDRWMTLFYDGKYFDWVHMAWTWCIIGNPSEAG